MPKRKTDTDPIPQKKGKQTRQTEAADGRVAEEAAEGTEAEAEIRRSFLFRLDAEKAVAH